MKRFAWRLQRILEIKTKICAEKPKQRLGKQEFFLRYSVTSDKKIKKLKRRASELELQQRDKIAEVIKVKRFKEGLEKLRTEAKIRFIKEQEKFEQKELDESSTLSFARNMISRGE
jgi:flagellar biosynthesis chaperone FliJ